jgi:chitin disaccharide deacetylase
MTRALIVNADDFGRSACINAGTTHAHEHGIVTSASLMVRCPAAGQAADYARAHPDLSVGLHVDLAEWAHGGDRWHAVYDFPTSDGDAVAAEVERQLDSFRRLLGRDPTHLDSHQHVHEKEPVRSILVRLAEELRRPLRSLTPDVTYVGSFYGQTAKGDPLTEAISVEALAEILASLGSGMTELGCHPGFVGDFESTYLTERQVEVKTLCDPRVRDVLHAEGIELRSFRIST